VAILNIQLNMINDLVTPSEFVRILSALVSGFLAPIPPTKSRFRILPWLVTFFLGLFFFAILAVALLEATPNDLSSQQWYELLTTKVGDRITANIEKRGET